MGFLAVFGALGFGRFGYSAILPAMQDDLGISSAAAGSLASWNLGGYVLMAAVGGILASRFGPRIVVGVGSVVAALGMAATGLSNGVVAASAARLLTGVGSGMVLVPSVALMSAWFDIRRRGMASGVVSSGSSLALVITGPVVPRIIEGGGAEGWRLAWYFFAALTLAVGVLTFIIQRNRPDRSAHTPVMKGSIWEAETAKGEAGKGNEVALAATLASWSPAPAPAPRTAPIPFDLRKVYRSRYAWHMGFVYFMFGFAYMIYFTFFQRRLTVDLGLSAQSAGRFFLALGVMSIAAGFIWGSISDRIGRGRAIGISCLLQAVSAALFAWCPTTPGLMISAVLCGLTAVAVPGIVGAGCGDQFGPVLASASLGFVTIFIGVGQVLGPYAAGLMADAFGSLKYSYLLAAGVFLVGTVLAAFLRETGWTAERCNRSTASKPPVTPDEARRQTEA
ncbi:MAG: YbfB/YjiJ family MFS transporter [Actinobacteria bacterium]|nr:YbfB/YjiJ family MFS transporter [Actinomycetota bacterium]